MLFIALFLVSAMFITQATGDNKSSPITVEFDIEHYSVDMGYAYVEFNRTLIDDNQVFTNKSETIYFGFSFDIAYSSLVYGGPYADGMPVEEWYYSYNETTEKYDVTRVFGVWNVYLDEYSLGLSNFDPGYPVANTKQRIIMDLEPGWHVLTVIGAEMISSEDGETFTWDVVKDQINFYIDEKVETEESKKEVSFSATTVDAEDLPSRYYDYDFANARPMIDINDDDYAALDQVVKGDDPLEVKVVYNASDNEFGVSPMAWGWMQYDGLDTMGPHTIGWFLNDGNVIEGASGTAKLNVGKNFLVFFVVGGTADDYIYGFYGFPPPTLDVASVVATIVVEETGILGFDFAIFISVSMLGLAVALIIRRK